MPSMKSNHQLGLDFNDGHKNFDVNALLLITVGRRLTEDVQTTTR